MGRYVHVTDDSMADAIRQYEKANLLETVQK